MIKDNQKYFNRLHLLIDAVIVACSYMLAWYLKFESVFATKKQGVGVLGMETYFYALYFIVPGYVILYYSFNMYTSKRTARRHIKSQHCGDTSVSGCSVCGKSA